MRYPKQVLKVIKRTPRLKKQWEKEEKKRSEKVGKEKEEKK